MKNLKENSYSIVDFPKDKNLFGNYIASTPKKAAEKAFSDLVILTKKQLDFENDKEDNTGKFIVFVIVNNKTSVETKYLGTRIKLDNKTTKFKYKNIIGLYRKELDLIK
jgi:hypothetical protein